MFGIKLLSMNEISPEIQYVEEKRLVQTLITEKPAEGAFWAASLTLLIVLMGSASYWILPAGFSALLPAVKSNIFHDHQYWRIFSAIFIHGDLEHLLSNALLLWIFSFFVFGYTGFKIFPIASLAVAAVINFIAVSTYPPNTELLGASGLVYVLGGFWLALYFQVQRQYALANRLIRVLGIAMMIFLPSTFVPTTSYRTHAIGFVAGIAMAIIYFYLNKQSIRSSEVYKVSRIEI